MLYKTIYNEIYTEDFNGNKIGYIRFENVGNNTFCITVTHVEPILAGQNVDSKLVELALKEIRSRKCKIKATDPFAKAWLARRNILE